MIINLLKKEYAFFVKRNIRAFTLAEVLLTLAIIGIVAALTIPSLISSADDAKFKSKMKKEFSVLSQVHAKITNDYGSLRAALSDCGSQNIHECFRDIVKPYLSYTSECNDGQSYGNCHPATVKELSGNTATTGYRLNRAGLVLADGATVMTSIDSNTCSAQNLGYEDRCGWINVDVNGLAPPNMWGKDIYTFYFVLLKVVPLGIDSSGSMDASYAKNCDTSGTGYGCAAKYLKE